MALIILNQKVYDEFQLDVKAISKTTQRVIQENTALKESIVKIDKKVNKIIFEHKQMIRMTYHSCGIEGSTLSLEELTKQLAPQLEKQIAEATQEERKKLRG